MSILNAIALPINPDLYIDGQIFPYLNMEILVTEYPASKTEYIPRKRPTYTLMLDRGEGFKRYGVYEKILISDSPHVVRLYSKST